MPLSNEQHYGIRPLTEAINLLPNTPTIIRQLGLFTPSMQTTTYVTVEAKNGILSLVPAVPRGTPGEPVRQRLGNRQTFEMLHLPKDDVVRADDVQNVRAFGTDNKAETVAEKVNDKLAWMKADLEYTREHLMLGALKGKILDADGRELIDLYDRFNLTRKVYNWKLSADSTNISREIDSIKTAQGKLRGGESLTGWIVLASESFMQAVIYHKSLHEPYVRYQDGALYREADTNVSFRHKGIDFIQYDHTFESGETIEEGTALLIPKGTRNTFREYFAPADMNATVNTKARPYYASREKMVHDKGWSLHAQSNPLPLVLRPELCATLTLS